MTMPVFATKKPKQREHILRVRVNHDKDRGYRFTHLEELKPGCHSYRFVEKSPAMTKGGARQRFLRAIEDILEYRFGTDAAVSTLELRFRGKRTQQEKSA